MAILDIFKKKEKEKKPKLRPEKIPTRTVKKKEVIEEKGKISEKPGISPVFSKVPARKATEEVYRAINIPHITEKATDLTKKNQYVFKVFAKANKIEIKKAVESLYGVNVIKVRIVNIPSKKRRVGRTIGKKSGYKKAIVKIAEGQKIEVLPR
jgi:large subunit ribosomal protein L23